MFKQSLFLTHDVEIEGGFGYHDWNLVDIFDESSSSLLSIDGTDGLELV